MIFREEKGQITVFLSLVFLVLFSFSFVVLEGIHRYLETSLAEEAFIGAENYVLANYDKSLFDRYHMFFMDPREEKYIESDGKKYINQYLDESSFYKFSCQLLEVTKDQRAVDEGGLYLKYQIREYMKYREAVKAGKAIQSLFQSFSGARDKVDNQAKQLDKVQQDAENANSTSSKGQEENKENEKNGKGEMAEEGVSAEKEDAGENTKEKIRWKDIKEMLQQVAKAGILNYVIDDVNDISKLSVSKEGLPSKEEQKGTMEEKSLYGDFSFTFTQVKEWKKLLNTDLFSEMDSKALTDDFFLLEYIFDSFGNYENLLQQTALQYEVEYLLGGKTSDVENLKYVANRILVLRFLTNYIFASQNAALTTKAEAMALALTGFLGLPEASKAVKILLLAALSYGESLLEIHTLFSGEKIPIIKNADTWNLTFENAVSLLKQKKMVKKGNINVGYEEYLRLLLAFHLESTALYYKMMDIMQLNVALDEPGFAMKDCIFSFYWEGEIYCSNWFSLLENNKKNSGDSSGRFKMELARMNSY